MKFKILILELLFTYLLMSCNDSKEEANTNNSEINNRDTSHVNKIEHSLIDTISIIKNLQGEWKEIQYPFNVAHFKDTTVKFIEEGVVDAPRFKEYKISKNCSYNVNNIKNAKQNDIFLVMPEAGTCEIIQISNDTLTLSGFNVSSNNNYNIIYKRVKN